MPLILTVMLSDVLLPPAAADDHPVAVDARGGNHDEGVDVDAGQDAVDRVAIGVRKSK